MPFRSWLAALFLALPAVAQVRPGRTVTPANIPVLHLPQPMLRRIIRDSERIFAGTVISIQRALDGPGVPITRVAFRIDEAVRGVKKGEIIQVLEWGGLWETGERYRMGEHVLLFLYPQSKLGLTSPVAGAMGRWSIQSDGKAQTKSVGTHIQRSQLRAVAASLRQAARE